MSTSFNIKQETLKEPLQKAFKLTLQVMCWASVLGRFWWGSLRSILCDLVTLDLACLSSYFWEEKWFLLEHIPSKIRKQRFEKSWTDSNLIKFQLPNYVIIVSIYAVRELQVAQRWRWGQLVVMLRTSILQHGSLQTLIFCTNQSI